MKSLKAIFRRQKHEDLSRASSISNLAHSSSTSGQGTNDEKKKTHGVLTKARKTLSKDRLDDDSSSSSTANVKRHSQRSIEIVEEDPQLQEKLGNMTSENAQLVMQLAEQRGQLNILQKEITRLKMYQEQSALQVEQLSDENASLRNKLRDVVHSPLSDNEKQQLLLDSHRHHSSAPASIAPNLHSLVMDEQQHVSSSDWDKQSTSNVSDVSVACLQDKINQMQETHYSTNEELQATLQELTDLQKQLGDLQQDNERLSEEKNLMFDSLCRQTERLTDARDEVESLKQVLYREDNGQYESVVEREQKLVDLLKGVQDEREMLLLKQEQYANEVQDLRTAALRRDEDNHVLGDRLNTLESTLDAKHAEHRQVEQELTRTKDLASSRMIEIDRLNEILENARTKILELEQDRALSDKSEVEELLDNARKEKDALEAEVANLKEQVARGKNELEKVKEQVSVLQEECKVLRNNAKCTRSELEYKVEKLSAEKDALSEQLQRLEEAANELQVQAQCQIEDKRQLSSVLSETQRNMSEVERRSIELETELNETKKLRQAEMDEWEKFQNDLLTSVRVANDFKNEAQQELQKFVMENKQNRERIRQLEGQLEKSKGKPTLSTTLPTTVDACACHFNIIDTISNSSNDSEISAPIKRLSKRDRETIEYINREYAKINFEQRRLEDLTADEQVIVKIKQSYDRHFNVQHKKPFAKKPIEDLAVSRPLLDSVYKNPVLKSLAENDNVPNVESEEFYEITRSKSTGDINKVVHDEAFQAKYLARFNEKSKRINKKGPLAKKHVNKKDIGSPIYNSVLNNDDLLKIIQDVNVHEVQRVESFSTRYLDPVNTNDFDRVERKLKSLNRDSDKSQDNVFIYNFQDAAVQVKHANSFINNGPIPEPEVKEHKSLLEVKLPKRTPSSLEEITFDFKTYERKEKVRQEEKVEGVDENERMEVIKRQSDIACAAILCDEVASKNWDEATTQNQLGSETELTTSQVECEKLMKIIAISEVFLRNERLYGTIFEKDSENIHEQVLYKISIGDSVLHENEILDGSVDSILKIGRNHSQNVAEDQKQEENEQLCNESKRNTVEIFAEKNGSEYNSAKIIEQGENESIISEPGQDKVVKLEDTEVTQEKNEQFLSQIEQNEVPEKDPSLNSAKIFDNLEIEQLLSELEQKFLIPKNDANVEFNSEIDHSDFLPRNEAKKDPELPSNSEYIMKIYNSQKEDLEEVDVEPEELLGHHMRYKAVVRSLKTLFKEPIKKESESDETNEESDDSEGLKPSKFDDYYSKTSESSDREYGDVIRECTRNFIANEIIWNEIKSDLVNFCRNSLRSSGWKSNFDDLKPANKIDLELVSMMSKIPTEDDCPIQIEDNCDELRIEDIGGAIVALADVTDFEQNDVVESKLSSATNVIVMDEAKETAPVNECNQGAIPRQRTKSPSSNNHQAQEQRNPDDSCVTADVESLENYFDTTSSNESQIGHSNRKSREHLTCNDENSPGSETVREKRELFNGGTRVYSSSQSSVPDLSNRSSEKVAALKKRFEGVEFKDALECGPTFHDIRSKPPKFRAEEVRKVVETIPSEEVKIMEETLDPHLVEGEPTPTVESVEDAEDTKSELRTSFQMAKKMFESQGK